MIHVGRRWDQVLGAMLLVGIALGIAYPGENTIAVVAGLGLSAAVAASVQVVSHWDKAILLRLGEFRGLRGPGLFVMAPFIDRIEAFVDQRVRATDFRAERILTLDTVPLYVDAICFWLVWDAEKAVLELESYQSAVILSAQTALKDAVGKHELADLLSNRQKLGAEIQKALDEKTNAWGITIQSIEITDVVLPEGLEEAMSKRAQAERERQARVILSTAEAEIAGKFAEAAAQYRGNPEALHLRAMNMVYEGIRQRGSMIIVPSSAVETMGLGAISGIAALARGEEPDESDKPDKPGRPTGEGSGQDDD
ncbi:MAG: slipin family protein [Deltaproteobacteria bacterium]|nr:slipin family protein [Deltaproteobacteria bacterium]MBW2414068.1 slipin family protein [Deltaproteobacteria bacterium]